ncbi:MAG: sensor histidine kinase, partial [Deltaproteobacteria bacterium]|nr:sensor histidine kinase [Deltaproteobacteria bacterium]
PDFPGMVRGDANRLRQILFNLAGNAVKFTDDGEVSVRAELLEQDGKMALIRFAVKDTGVGIPADKQGMLFEKFTQADVSVTRKYGGTGLGLAISRRLSKLMGGEIGLSSVEGQGSEFWFTVRLGMQENQDRAERHDLDCLAGIKVLVVDDNATNREMLSARLTSWMMHVDQAEDGPSALATLYKAMGQGQPFNLALLDMYMPGMSGDVLARAIRSDPRLSELKLVLLSSLDRNDDQGTSTEGLFQAALTKPVRRTDLLTILIAVAKGRSVLTVHGPNPGEDRTRLARLDFSKAGARVLLAEDNAVNRQVALGLLHKFGVEASVAVNGLEALKALGNETFDLVFMDVQMPELNGVEATKSIRAPKPEGLGLDVPIVAMTAHAMQGDRERFLAVGMNDYISKPISPKEIGKALERWLSSPTPTRAADPELQNTAPDRQKDLPAFDRIDFMDRVMGDQDLARQVVDVFMRDAYKRFESIRQGVEGGNLAMARAATHTLKGSAGNVGARAMAFAAAKLEAALAADDQSGAVELLKALPG